MDKVECTTQFASADRSDNATIARQRKLFADTPLVTKLYDTVSEIVFILNENRQIVFYNNNLLDFVGKDKAESIYGLRPGEAFSCAHAARLPGGCGTTKFCSACGAVNAILTSQDGKVDVQECRLNSDKNTHIDAMDLLVRTTPFEWNGENFTVCAVTDISSAKRKKALEQVFFHDLLNTVAGMKMLSEGLYDTDSGILDEVRKGICTGAVQLLEEIRSQKDLVAAENNELRIHPEMIKSKAFLTQLIEYYISYEQQNQCRFILADNSEDIIFRSDRVILFRVLGNMLKNAAEASEKGQCITIGCVTCNKNIKFFVHNESFIPENVRLQIFHRSFTTKGTGRGLGTYSMKLLTERYLKGKIVFTTSPQNGTTFIAEYPLTLE